MPVLVQPATIMCSPPLSNLNIKNVSWSVHIIHYIILNTIQGHEVGQSEEPEVRAFWLEVEGKPPIFYFYFDK